MTANVSSARSVRLEADVCRTVELVDCQYPSRSSESFDDSAPEVEATTGVGSEMIRACPVRDNDRQPGNIAQQQSTIQNLIQYIDLPIPGTVEGIRDDIGMSKTGIERFKWCAAITFRLAASSSLRISEAGCFVAEIEPVTLSVKHRMPQRVIENQRFPEPVFSRGNRFKSRS